MEHLERVPKGPLGCRMSRPNVHHALQGQDRSRRRHQRTHPRIAREREWCGHQEAAQRAARRIAGKVCIVGRNPDAMWFDDYEDRVLYDEAGLFEYTRVKKDALLG